MNIIKRPRLETTSETPSETGLGKLEKKEINKDYLKELLTHMQERKFNHTMNVLEEQDTEEYALERIFNRLFSDTERLTKILIEIQLGKEYKSDKEAYYNLWLAKMKS